MVISTGLQLSHDDLRSSDADSSMLGLELVRLVDGGEKSLEKVIMLGPD